MRQHWANKNGVSLSKEFTDAEKAKRLSEKIKEKTLREKYSLSEKAPSKNWWNKLDEAPIEHVTNFEPMPKIYPKPIQPLQQPHDGVDTIASCFGRKEKCFLIR